MFVWVCSLLAQDLASDIVDIIRYLEQKDNKQ